jgi:hypothetical protein
MRSRPNSPTGGEVPTHEICVLVAILAEDLEEKAIDTAKKAGAGGVTLLDARGIGANEKKTFFGLTYEGSQTCWSACWRKSCR